MSSPSTEVVSINLNKPFAARVVEIKELIQKPAYVKVRELIRHQLSADDSKETAGVHSLHRQHNAIAISGGRGTGKTTFMLSLQKILEEDAENEGPGNWTTNIVWLRPIDPTLIETKENIVVTVLSEMVRFVESKYRNCKPDNLDNPEKKYNEYRESLKNLAEGLNVLEGIGDSGKVDADWENPQYVMERGLGRAKSGMNLERCLHDFIDKSLAFLNKKAFLLISSGSIPRGLPRKEFRLGCSIPRSLLRGCSFFDDIDTQFDRGWMVLEVVRKYLTSPKLIMLVLGDLHLYSLLVRGQQWKMLGKVLPRRELTGTAVASAIDQLESQYLQKILKSQYRIDLKTMGSLIAEPTSLTISVIRRCEAGKDQAPTKLKPFVERICREALQLKDQRDVFAMRDLILRQPVRSILHLLGAPAIEAMLRATDDDIKISNDQLVLAVVDFLAQWSLDALHTYAIRIDELHGATDNNVLDLAIRFLTEAAVWRDGYRLKPEFLEDRINLALLALGSRITLALKSAPQLLGDYFIRIGVTRDAALMKDAKTYLEFVSLTTQRTLLTIACRAIGYIRSIGNGTADNAGPRLGAIAILTHISDTETTQRKLLLALVRKRSEPIPTPANLFYKPYADNIQKRFKELKLSDSKLPDSIVFNTVRTLQVRVAKSVNLVGLPALQLTDVTGKSTAYLSIFPLIAIISELLEGRVEDVMKNLVRWGQVRSFPVYCEPQHLGVSEPSGSHHGYRKTGSVTLELRGRPDPNPSPEKKETTKPEKPNKDRFVLFVERWVSEYKPPIELSPLPSHVLGDIWARFYHAMEHVDETQIDEWYAGNLLHRYIVTFLNAMLVEEHLARNHVAQMHLLSPASADWMFLSNLGRYLEKPSNYPWFDLFFRCPIWGAYLRPSLAKPSKNSEDGRVWERHIERGPIFRTGKLMLLYQLTRSFHETYSPSYFSRRI